MDIQSQQNALDPQAVNLAKAIRQTESGGNFQARGKSGEFGAYQYTGPTWASDSQKYLGQIVPLEKATPQQQNEVAYKKVKELKDRGYNVGQIASIWNSGNPDAYQDPNYKGTNKYGAHYDVAKYAKSVATAYQTLKNGGQVSVDPNNPSSVANPENKPEEKSISGFLGNVVNSGANLIGGIATSVAHPIQTVENIGTAVTHPGLILDALKQRYGGLQNIKDTLYKDPLGVALDAATVLGGAGAAGKLAEEGSDLSRIGELAGKAGEAINPINIPIKAASKIAGAASDYAGGSAGRVINSLIKPLSKDFAYGSDPGRTISELGITGNTLEELEKNVIDARKTIGQNIRNLYNSPVAQATKIDLSSALQPLDDALTKLKKAPRVNASVISRLEGIRDDLMGIPLNTEPGIMPQATRNLVGITPAEAFDFKSDIGDLTKFTGNISDDNIINKALKQSWGKISSQLADLDESGQLPGLKKLNQQYGDLSSAESAIKHREMIASRQNLVSLNTRLSGLGGGLIGGLIAGHPLSGILTALLGASSEEALSSTAFKTRLAKYLAKLSPMERVEVLKSFPQLKKATIAGGLLPRLAKVGSEQNQQNR